MEDKFFLSEVYSEEEITTQINRAITNEGYYHFYILSPDNWKMNFQKYYLLSPTQLQNLRHANSQKEMVKIVFREGSLRNGISEISTYINYTHLLGKAFFCIREMLGMDEWDNVMAACVFSEISISISKSVQALRPGINIELSDGIANKNLKIIERWHYFGSSRNVTFAHPFWYIDKALKAGAFKVSDTLLAQVKKKVEESPPEDHDDFIKNYRNIATRLNLSLKCFEKQNEIPFAIKEPKIPFRQENGINKNDAVKIKQQRKRKKPLERQKLEDFVKHLVNLGVARTYSDFVQVMTEDYIYSDKGMPDAGESYNEHPEVKRVYCVREDGKYKVHFSFMSNNGKFESQETYSLISFKDIFDTVRTELNSEIVAE